MGAGLTIGIAGLGNIGAVHAQVLSTMSDVSTIHFADPAHGREGDLKRAFFGLSEKAGEFFHDYKELRHCEAVIIALPTGMHHQAVQYFAGLGIPMLIEKPLGLNYYQAVHIMAIVKARSVPAMCGLTGLYHPEFAAMYRALPSIGELVSVRERLHSAHPNLARSLEETRGVMTINGIHTLHRFWKIAALKQGDCSLNVSRVSKGRQYFQMRGEDEAHGLLYLGEMPFLFEMSFRNGTECDNGLPMEYILTITGARGMIIVRGFERCDLQLFDGSSTVLYEHPDGPVGHASAYSRTMTGLRRELFEFLLFLDSGDMVHHTMDEALAAQKLVEECYDMAVFV